MWSAPARWLIRSRHRRISGSPTMSHRWCRRRIRSVSGIITRPPTRRPICDRPSQARRPSRGRPRFASNKYTWDQTHLSNAVSLKSDTKGVFDFDLSASSYNYLQDMLLNPFTVVPAPGLGYSLNGKITRNDGTNWQNADAKGIWRPFGVDGPHEVSFGVHGDRYRLENPVYASSVWYATPSTGTGQLYSTGVGETRTEALWVQDAWKIVPNLKLTLGGRLEDWRAFDGFNINTTTNAAGGITSIPSPTQSARTEFDQFLAEGLAVVRSQQGLEHYREFRRGLPLSDRHRALSKRHGRRRYCPRQSVAGAGAGFHRRIERRAPLERWPGPADAVQGKNQQRASSRKPIS